MPREAGSGRATVPRYSEQIYKIAQVLKYMRPVMFKLCLPQDPDETPLNKLFYAKQIAFSSRPSEDGVDEHEDDDAANGA